jgi:hypothetical protein
MSTLREAALMGTLHLHQCEIISVKMYWSGLAQGKMDELFYCIYQSTNRYFNPAPAEN